MIAQDRFNRLVLVFGYEDGGYMAPLYPYFFDVDGFADVKVVGLTAEQQAKDLQIIRNRRVRCRGSDRLRVCS